MAKITLPPISGSYASVVALNDRFQQIEDAFNDDVLWRDGFVGEPNSMAVALDMSSYQMLNLPVPATPTSPVRLQELTDLGTISSITTSVTVASKAIAASLIPTVGQTLYILSDDGKDNVWQPVTGAPPGTYSDDDATYCGRWFIPTGGDGSSAWLRDYNGTVRSVWYGLTTGEDVNGERTVYVNPATSKVQAGPVITQTSPYGTTGASHWEFNVGSDTPEPSVAPIMQIDKWTNANVGDVTWSQAFTAKIFKLGGGDTPAAAITGYGDKLVGGGLGGIIGVHGRVTMRDSTTDGSAYAGWFYATADVGSSGDEHVTAIEVDMQNNDGDKGHIESGVPFVTDTMTTGVWAWPGVNSPAGSHVTFAFGCGAGANSQWHTGVYVQSDSIVPYDGVTDHNEGVLVQGGTTLARRYGGIRLGDVLSPTYFHYGIDLSGGIFTNQTAIRLGDLHHIQFGDGNDAAIQWTTTNLRVSTSSGDIQLEPTGVVDFSYAGVGTAGAIAEYIEIKVNGVARKIAAYAVT